MRGITIGLMIFLVCGLVGCSPSSSQIEAAIAQTEVARPTVVPSPTALPSATVTRIPTPKRTPPPTPVPAMTVSDAEELAFPRGYLFTDEVDRDGRAYRAAVRLDINTGIMIYGTSAISDDLSLIEMVVLEGYGVPATIHLAEVQWFLQTYGSAEISAWALDHIPEFGEDPQMGVFGLVSVLVTANSASSITFVVMLR